MVKVKCVKSEIEGYVTPVFDIPDDEKEKYSLDCAYFVEGSTVTVSAIIQIREEDK